MSLLSVARAYYQRQARITRVAQESARQVWRDVQFGDLDRSWARVSQQMVVAVGAAQLLSAQGADPYLDEALTEQDADTDRLASVAPLLFAGVASDGRSLESLLLSAIIAVKVALTSRVQPSPERAMARGEATLLRIVDAQVTDAGRVATSVAISARPQVQGWVRMISSPACSRCVILAGKYFRWNRGFERHPQCVPAGTVVSGPASEAAARRWYQGELVTLTTASGQQLALTGNHPVLTRRGWVPANLLREGDDVVRSTRPQGASALVVPDHDQVPARIEDVWRSLGVAGLERMPSSPQDFHGDGGHGEVDVVYADRALGGHAHATLSEHGVKRGFSRRGVHSLRLQPQTPAQLGDLRHHAPSGRVVRGPRLRLPLLHGHLGGPQGPRLLGLAAGYPGFGEAPGYHTPTDAVLPGERELAGAAEVGSADRLHWQPELLPRWDAPGDPFTVESSDGYAALGVDLLQRLAGAVELDRVVELRRTEWSGHVYNLTSAEGWYSANSLIISNCNCVHIPSVEDDEDLRTDPKAYFESLDKADQDKYFTATGAQAIRDGADMNQVVNARRRAAGMSQPGRLTAAEQRALRARGAVTGPATTTEGTTVRGLAGQRLARESGATRLPGQRLRTANAPRLMPEGISQIAGDDRAERMRLLRSHGYIV